MFVNEGFIDVTESMQLMEQDDAQSVETISTEVQARIVLYTI